ncbi:hypothetical protein H9Q72_001206 [Fusarium xylarioides]|uniref:Uncharacterized protein n=1 Tax=Fusarium xylarioides TaxID=221167 RepID=A0A9P7IUA7_9HYPO|nr:hypothetical protein H9Q72_001206 [Fusarium xylarioides]KAG5817402.1 hypothetical protein H9Q71_001906 [Fusarium xylarioides]KAG5829281.1 hypothetical protein H9Q74_000677 [Fusarium xylarioides]
MSAMREDGMPHQSTFGLEVRQEIADDTDKPRVDDYISTWDDGATDDLDSGWLCKAFPNAANIQHGRVMAYNYQSDLTANNILDELTLHAAAVTLLEAIEGKQTADEDALWVANHEKRFLSTAHLARALILFATPSPSSAWDESLLNIVLATSGSAQRQKGLEVLLSTGCKALRTTSDRFESLLNQYKVETVAEILGTSLIGMMVSSLLVSNSSIASRISQK